MSVKEQEAKVTQALAKIINRLLLFSGKEGVGKGLPWK